MWEVERFERDEGYAKDSGEIDLDDGACYKHVTRKGVDVVGKRKKRGGVANMRPRDDVCKWLNSGAVVATQR